MRIVNTLSGSTVDSIIVTPYTTNPTEGVLSIPVGTSTKTHSVTVNGSSMIKF
jgi:hypothetical protein